MRQKIYTLGIISNLLVFTGALFKMFHFPAAGILLTVGMIILIFLFLPLALRNHFRSDGNRKNLFLYIITWLTCFVVFTSMLFKIMHWPLAGYLLLIALPFPYVIFLPVFIFSTAKNKNFSIYNTLGILFLLTIVSAFSALLALNVSRDKIVDSLEIVRNYNSSDPLLVQGPSQSDKSPVNFKIGEILNNISNCRRLILSNKGIDPGRWEADPGIIIQSGLSQIRSSKNYSDEVNSAESKIESDLSELIILLEKTSGCEKLAKSAPDIFGLQRLPGGNFIWSEEVERNSAEPWPIIYLEGLETNLKMFDKLLATVI